MTETYEQQRAKRRIEAKRILALVESGDAMRLKYFWLRFTSGVGAEFLFEPEAFDRLCGLLGSDIKGAVRFTNRPATASYLSSPVWFRADTLCSIQESPHYHYFLVNGQVEFIDRDDLPEGYSDASQ